MAKVDQEKLEAMRHTAAHLLAAAVKDLWPGTHNAIGPAIENGFYQDFDFGERTISEDDLPKIEKRMRELLKSWGPFEERVVSIEEARELFADNPYKLELAEGFAQEGKKITVNDPGNFLDLCKGGHSEDPKKELSHIKLLSLAGAYWRGDEKNKMLTRIYGTAFFTKEELKEHLVLLAEAKKRDHRKLGKDLDLFTFSPLVGPGLPLFTPRGTVIRRELENFLESLQEPRGYQRVFIPHIAKADLYRTSGHWDKFQDHLFHVRGSSDEEFVLKPMNCPHHTQLYAAKKRSYRDLPLRFSEVTTVYRDEQAGELLGLTRVRSITQDDAHVFCRADQIKDEVALVLSIINDFYAPFDFELSVQLSVRDRENPKKYIGPTDVWDEAESQLVYAINMALKKWTHWRKSGPDYGEAAFYGPKIDFMARDSLKRTWQLATVQLDFNMPQRFGLNYTDETGAQQTPVMIHRAILGSFERFMAILLEHYNGALPLWLSPTQVVVLPISDDQNDYAQGVVDQLGKVGLRVEVDQRSESIGKKIREAEMMKVPVMLVVGKKEAGAGTVSVRSREDDFEGEKKVDEVVTKLQAQVAERR